MVPRCPPRAVPRAAPPVRFAAPARLPPSIDDPEVNPEVNPEPNVDVVNPEPVLIPVCPVVVWPAWTEPTKVCISWLLDPTNCPAVRPSRLNRAVGETYCEAMSCRPVTNADAEPWAAWPVCPLPVAKLRETPPLLVPPNVRLPNIPDELDWDMYCPQAAV